MMLQWEIALSQQEVPRFLFPESHLLQSLIDIFFQQINPYLPLLHRPTVQKHVEENLHLRDYQFGALVMMICALASTHDSDSRIFLPNMFGASLEQSAGFKYFSQVQVMRRSLFSVPSIFDIQTYAVSCLPRPLICIIG